MCTVSTIGEYNDKARDYLLYSIGPNLICRQHYVKYFSVLRNWPTSAGATLVRFCAEMRRCAQLCRNTDAVTKAQASVSSSCIFYGLFGILCLNLFPLFFNKSASVLQSPGLLVPPSYHTSIPVFLPQIWNANYVKLAGESRRAGVERAL